MSSTATATETRASSSAASSSSLSVCASSSGTSLRPTATRTRRRLVQPELESPTSEDVVAASSASSQPQPRPPRPRQSSPPSPTKDGNEFAPMHIDHALLISYPDKSVDAAAPFLSPKQADRIQQLGVAPEPLWSYNDEQKFRSRSMEDWLHLKRGLRDAVYEMERCRDEADEAEAGSGEEEHWRELELKAHARVDRLLFDEGFLLLGLRVKYWLYETKAGVPPSRVLSRLAKFPPEFQPTWGFREAADLAATHKDNAPHPFYRKLEKWWRDGGDDSAIGMFWTS